ncbi:MAG: mechanosensitive ion channel family protein [Candidatus Woesearchaeota archaeon]|jgi:small-conductance mechanosensitive channel|nr:mechanosensitive ion channel family protein [Candidatus Woesearchaeota archaeon]
MNESNLSAVAETVGTLKNISLIFNNFLLALFILAGGFFIGRFIGKLVQKILGGIELDGLAKKVFKRNIPLQDSISFVISGAIYLLSIILALKEIGIAAPVFRWLAAAFIVLILISAALYVKDAVPSIISGLKIIGSRQIRAGDHIKIDEHTEGDVIKVDLTELRLKTEKGDLIYVPNSIISKSKVEIRKKL